jgi:general secretion pathway protein F
MPLNFDLVVRTPAGSVQSLSISAADAAAAHEQALRQGLQVLGCTGGHGSAQRRKWVALRPRASLDVATLSLELASLLAAGLSVVDALRTLASNESLAARRSVLLNVLQAVSEGLPLSTALQRSEHRFPPLLVATVSASEQTGDLGTALARYAEHEQRLRGLRDKVVGAAIYPVLLLALGSLVVAFLLGVVVPKFAVLIESTRRELPWSSQLMITWGRFAASHAGAAAGVALTALVALVVAARRVARNHARARWIEALPLIGPSIRLFRHSQLYRTTGMLVKGGIAAPRALQLAASLLGDDDRTRLAQAVARIHEGRSLSDALSQAGLADPVTTSMLSVAERTGALAEILERIASFQEARLARSVEMTSRLFEPLLMIGIGLVIGAIVVLMYLPIFDLASSLQ